ncbi:hypothetical protein Q5O14_18175 [Eubacteriaceae bacterium ES2]|nr:hypothetical protein Q5O14_18175 [Eubacteriaceae bacterium ES2]
MNQIKKKRRLSPLETSVFGNVIYILIVLLFKNIFDVFYGDEFNYFLSGIELLVVALFWIGLFAISFKNIYAGEKKRYGAYVFYSLLPILLLTAAVTAVTIFAPGQDTSSVWNQFTFLAAPTIFWYLPFGLIYQILNGSITIFTHFAISLLITLVFQVTGIAIGRLMGRKYWLESSAELQVAEEGKPAPRSRRKKSKVRSREVIGMEGMSDEIMNENFVPEKPEIMTEVIIEDHDQPRMVRRKKVDPRRRDAENFADEALDDTAAVFEQQESSASIPILEDAAEVGGETRISETRGAGNEQSDDDKSFLMETSQVRIINDEDIEEYYRNKK